MAQWKKVIVSGSTANLANAQIDGLTSGQVVIGGGTAGNLTTTAINGTGNIVATTGAAVNMSGSFSGSFQGNGSGLTNVTATATFPTTLLTPITSATQIFANDGVNKYVTAGQITGSAYAGVVGDITIGTNGVAAIGSSKVTSAMIVDGTITGTDIASATVANSNLVNSSITIGSTSTALGATSTIVAGLTSVTSTTFVGNLTGTATTASNITPAITNNTDNYILTATGNNPNGESNLTFDGTTLTVTGNATITNNLIVQGTASFQNTTNLEVADRFVLFASGSNTAGDGGIVVQQGTQNVGELYGYDSATTRWGFTSSFSADQSSFTPIAHITTTEFAASNPSAAPIYGGSSNGYGNIHVNSSTGDIFIYA